MWILASRKGGRTNTFTVSQQYHQTETIEQIFPRMGMVAVFGTNRKTLSKISDRNHASVQVCPAKDPRIH
jgi:hypothetical protein